MSALDAKLIQHLQLPPKLCARNFPAQQLAIHDDRPFDLPGRFVQEFNPESPRALRQHARNKLRSSLRQRVKDGVPAAGVGLERMQRPDAVALLKVVLVEVPPAV